MNYEVLIWEYATAYQVNAHLASAIAHVESGLNPNVARYESHYKWLFNPEKFVNHSNTLDTETMFQKTSFGLFQLMGANFRELGFKADWGLVFQKTTIQVDYGIKFLKKLSTKYDKIEDCIAAYNSGRPKKDEGGRYDNQIYVDKVLAEMLRRKGSVNNGGLT